MPRLFPLVLSALIGFASDAGAQSDRPVRDYVRVDPADLVTAESCGECHVNEYEVWKTTAHSTGFKTLHRKESAGGIARRLGFRLIKRDSLCVRCHYSPTIDDGQLRAGAGVSCESCHGAGRPWLDVHNTYGTETTWATEPPQHREERIQRSRELGMRRPSDIYDVAANCFSCHTVPEEELVNVGGHTTGTSSFELLERSQESIRHNFLDSLRGGAVVNRRASPGRRRLLFVAGRALDLEFSLRGMAEATADGIYSRAMNRRVRSATAEVRSLARSATLPELDRMLDAVRSADAVPGRRAELLDVADRVSEETRALLTRLDGEGLARLDPLIAGEEPVFEEEVAESGSEEVRSQDTPRPVASGDLPPSASEAVSEASGGGAPAEGAMKSRLRPVSRHRSLGPGACSGCHAPQNTWWFDDPHFAAADPFFSQRPEALRIAKLYGIPTSNMTRGDQLCMDCHGSVISGKERREVLDGVGCEACHGPAADYLKIHGEGDVALDRRRPGYLAALENGMVGLVDPERRAAVCASCHYVTDRRLISAGHPTGGDYDFAAAVGRIRHWDTALENETTSRGAWTSTVSARGPIPTVRMASLPAAAEVPAESFPSRPSNSTRPRHGEATVPPPRPFAAAGPPTSTRPLNLPPFPQIGTAMPIEDAILALESRLDLLYALVRDQDADDE